jgi:hypothetical protein
MACPYEAQGRPGVISLVFSGRILGVHGIERP